jgi:hypothetical protein
MMCEVCEAESTSGGVSRRVDVVGISGADFEHIGGNMQSWGLRSDSLSSYTALDASHNL